MNTGISTGCLYPMLTEDSVAALTELGFRRFEVFFNSFSELEPDSITRLRRRLERYDARAVSVHPFTSSFESFLLFSNYERRFLDGVRFYEMFFRSARLLGADKVILHGLSIQYRSTISDEEYFRRFSLLQERAGAYGVCLLQENVSRFRSRQPEFIRSMAEAVPEKAAFVCDVKQALRSEIDPCEMIRAMGTRLRHVHISDRDINGECVLPGRGCYDLKGLIDCLCSMGYDGDLIIEVYRFSYDDPRELCAAENKLKELIAAAGTNTEKRK